MNTWRNNILSRYIYMYVQNCLVLACYKDMTLYLLKPTERQGEIVKRL